jgi:predicted MPP superfamily phosphohydrolase
MGAQRALLEQVRAVSYDLCVLTGDYRFRTFGDIGPALDGLRRLRAQLSGTAYAVLGNHDSVCMVPDMEQMGFHVLLNEHVAIERSGARLYLAGIDDAHFFGVGSIEKALLGVPAEAYTVLLSHTPEVYRQAAHAAVDLLLAGHTHGGQICLPGGVPVLLDARIPRALGRGRWQHHAMRGYTSPGAGSSIVGQRLNCPPEITLHELRRDGPASAQ